MSYSSQDTCELVRACADLHNGAAWQEFIRRFQKLIAGVVLRTCARWGEHSPNVVDDLVQEIYLKLCADNCRILMDFQSRHPDAIYGYIKVITANAVNDYFRAFYSDKRGGGAATEDVTTIQCAVDGQRSGSAGAIERAVLLGEIERCLERCTQNETGARDRLIFRLYYFQRFSAKAIAALPEIGLTVKGVESAIFRIIGILRAELAGQSNEAKKVKESALGEKGIRRAKASYQGEGN